LSEINVETEEKNCKKLGQLYLSLGNNQKYQ
jgi:hypothetical protein